jgi:hypothetical protein
VATFQRTRDAEYRALAKEADRFRRSHGTSRTNRPASGTSAAAERAVARLRERFMAIERKDFFRAASKQAAADAIAAAEALLAPAKAEQAVEAAPALPARRFRRRRWITRPRPGAHVHDLDMKETRYAPPDAPAVARLVEGLRLLHTDDGELLEAGRQVFEALARSFESMLSSHASHRGRPRARARRARSRR